MYFIVFFFGIVWVLNINKYSSNFNCNECKYCILELKMEFSHKKPFSICFVHKSRKFSNFEPTLEYIMLRNFQTIRPIFPKIAPKVAQNLKEKSNESSRCGNFFCRNYRAKRRGGGGFRPPPALLGLRRFSSWWYLWKCKQKWFLHSWLCWRVVIIKELQSIGRHWPLSHGENQLNAGLTQNADDFFYW